MVGKIFLNEDISNQVYLLYRIILKIQFWKYFFNYNT